MQYNQTQNLSLFAVYLGGKAPRAHIEVHDVVFVVAASIEQTYQQLLDAWFGLPDNLHIDAWVRVDQVDGYQISLVTEKPEPQTQALYFVNLGAYRADVAGEIHNSTLMVDKSANAVKVRAKQSLITNADEIHTDDLFEVDDCLQLDQVGGYHLVLTPVEQTQSLQVVNGYHPLPKKVIADWKAAK